MDFSLIERAGLTQSEFAQLCGVTRVTTNLWATGKMNPHRYISSKVASILRAIETAIQNEKLPIATNVTKTDRQTAIDTAINLAEI